MRHDSPQPELWSCHWDHMCVIGTDGRRIQTTVWICQHPFRTMRLNGPEECSGCPVWESLERAKTRLPQPANPATDELLSGL
jgi:hypothetical protein